MERTVGLLREQRLDMGPVLAFDRGEQVAVIAALVLAEQRGDGGAVGPGAEIVDGRTVGMGRGGAQRCCAGGGEAKGRQPCFYGECHSAFIPIIPGPAVLASSRATLATTLPSI